MIPEVRRVLSSDVYKGRRRSEGAYCECSKISRNQKIPRPTHLVKRTINTFNIYPKQDTPQ